MIKVIKKEEEKERRGDKGGLSESSGQGMFPRNLFREVVIMARMNCFSLSRDIKEGLQKPCIKRTSDRKAISQSIQVVVQHRRAEKPQRMQNLGDYCETDTE